MLIRPSLNQDMQNSAMILAKVKKDSYAQNLYAAMCNMRWEYVGAEWARTAGDAAVLAKDEPWSCTWRSSGGIVADLRGEGDYLDWYCSGIHGGNWGDGEEIPDYVAEGTVTDEIRTDLGSLGWQPCPWDDEEQI